MSVFRLDAADSAKDIDVAILQALLKGMWRVEVVTYSLCSCSKVNHLFRSNDFKPCSEQILILKYLVC